MPRRRNMLYGCPDQIKRMVSSLGIITAEQISRYFNITMEQAIVAARRTAAANGFFITPSGLCLALDEHIPESDAAPLWILLDFRRLGMVGEIQFSSSAYIPIMFIGDGDMLGKFTAICRIPEDKGNEAVSAAKRWKTDAASAGIPLKTLMVAVISDTSQLPVLKGKGFWSAAVADQAGMVKYYDI